MKKLKLDLDRLDVQSFKTTDGKKGRTGTVRGYGPTDASCTEDHTFCGPYTCQDITCNGVTCHPDYC